MFCVWSMFTLFLFQQLILIAIVNSDCKWTTLYQGRNHTLNLNPIKTIYKCHLRGKIVWHWDGSNHNYSFSICSDGLLCNGQNAMVTQKTMNVPESACYIPAFWNPTIQPQYFEVSVDKAYTFSYIENDDCGSPYRSRLNPHFIVMSILRLRCERFTPRVIANILLKYRQNMRATPIQPRLHQLVQPHPSLTMNAFSNQMMVMIH